jgi:cytochrome c-type biogenesis protein CcmH
MAGADPLEIIRRLDCSAIKDYFAAQYGDRVLGEPPRRGLHWLVYILPPMIFLVGVVIVWQVFRSSRKTKLAPATATAVTDQPANTPDEADVLRRIEEDLQNRER